MEFLGISLVEWVGYAAMATVLISFLMKSVNKLRIVNTLRVFTIRVLWGYVSAFIKTHYYNKHRYFLYQYLLSI